MELVIGKPFGQLTRLDTEERLATLALDKPDRLTLLLGANVVEVRHADGGWTIHCSRNVTVVPGSPQELFVEAGENNLVDTHNKVFG